MRFAWSKVAEARAGVGALLFGLLYMRIRLALLLISALSVFPIVPAAAAGAERFALVIGNAKYPDAEAPLKEPINDARAIAEELKRDGFASRSAKI